MCRNGVLHGSEACLCQAGQTLPVVVLGCDGNDTACGGGGGGLGNAVHSTVAGNGQRVAWIDTRAYSDVWGQ
jgi:hypothetical protein